MPAIPDDDDAPDPRRRARPRDDDDRTERKPAKSGGVPVWVYIVGGVFLLMFVGCGGILVAVGMMASRAAKDVQAEIAKAQAEVAQTQAKALEQQKEAMAKQMKALEENEGSKGKKKGGPAVAKITRDELKTQLMGKSKAEVLAKLGTPDVTTDVFGQESLEYKNRTNDPATGKTDTGVIILLVDGVVSSFLFH